MKTPQSKRFAKNDSGANNAKRLDSGAFTAAFPAMTAFTLRP